MLPTPNLQTIAHQTQELAKNSKDHRLGLVFQSVSMISMAVLGIGGAIHLLRDMLRNSHHQHQHADHTNQDHPHTAKSDHRPHARPGHSHDEPSDNSMTRHVRHRSQHGHGRG